MKPEMKARLVAVRAALWIMIVQVFTALSQLLQCTLFGLYNVGRAAFGPLEPAHREAWADETLSARAYREDLDGRLWAVIARPLFDVLLCWRHGWKMNHCARAAHYEAQRRSRAPEDRGLT